MKKICLSLVVVLVVFVVPVWAADFKTFDSPVDAEVISEKAFVRAEHDNASKRLVTLEEGDAVSLIGEWSDDGGAFPWYAVMIKAETGWIYGQNVQRLDGKPTAITQGQKSVPEPGVLASDGDYVTVVARGQGTDRAKALEQAWIEAVRLAVGATISSKSELNDDEFAENTIAHSRGVIEGFDILDEKNDGKRAAVTIQAKVHKEILTDAAKVYAEAHTVKADTGGAIKAQLDVKAKDATADNKQKSGTELLKEVLESYGPEMFYTATLDPKIYYKKSSNKPYIQITEKFNQDLFWKEFIPRLHKALEGIATKKEKRFYEDSVRKANQALVKEGFVLWKGVYYNELQSDVEEQNAKLSDKRVFFCDKRGNLIPQSFSAPFSWYKENVDGKGRTEHPSGGFIIPFNQAKSPVPIKAVIPENNTSYVVYYLPCEFALETDKEGQRPTSNPELRSVLRGYTVKMLANTVLMVTYLDKDGDEIHTQLLRLGLSMLTIYRNFYYSDDSNEIDGRISQVFAVAPGYIGEGNHLFLGSSNYNAKYSAGWYIELDENDLQKLDSMKLEVVFEN
jgi:hypothetical protein